MKPFIVVNRLQELGFSVSRAYRVLEIADQHGESREPIEGGVVSVKRIAGSEFEMDVRKVNSGTRNRLAHVAQSSDARYSSVRGNKGKTPIPSKRSKPMPKRGAAVAEPEVDETEDGVKDYTIYAEKDPTPTMQDFADWLIEEVGLEFKSSQHEDEFRTGVRLGGTLRMEFQRSDFNKERKAERRAARAEENGADEVDETEEAPAKPARGRQAAKAGAAKAGPTKGAAKAAATTPAAPRRGRRATAAAATSGEAPF